MSSFKELLKQINDDKPKLSEEEEIEENYDPFAQDYYDSDELPISDDLTNAILMHRNAHFGGKFDFMLDYYKNQGPGCHSEFEYSNIQKIAQVQEEACQDLAPLNLSTEEMQKVKTVLELYQGLRKLHDSSKDPSSIPTLLTELILTEEHTPTEIINALAKNEKSLPYLLDILRSEDFLDPLFPGYGRTPLHIAQCLGQMKAEKAIIPLFESIKEDHFQYEEAAILALKNIGQPAFDFLLKVLNNVPFTQDNEKAAICLINFGESEVFGRAALKLLKNFQVFNFPNLVIHLILACIGLKEASDIEDFLQMKNYIPNMFQIDFQFVSSKLKKRDRNLDLD